MSRWTVPIIVLPLIVAGWWFLQADPEAEIVSAHQTLARLISKGEDDGGGPSILETRALQNLFGDTCVVTGDAVTLAGSYAPEEMVRTILGLRARLSSVTLTFNELTVEFPASNEAVATFVAMVEGRSLRESEEHIVERRDVVSRMRQVDGDWRFFEFHLTSYSNSL